MFEPDAGGGWGAPAAPQPGRVTRRRFLAGAGAAGIAGMATAAVVTRPWDALVGSTARSGPVAAGAGPLVLVTLYGGNDGLNTVVPMTDTAYQAARPTLGYTPEQVLPLGDGLGLNPHLPGLHSLWSAGRLAIVRGVGYPNPNLSHFASMDIWQTANPSDGSGPGWLGRWLDATGTDPMRAVSVGAALPPVLRGERQAATAVTSPQIVLPGGSALQAAFASLQSPGPDRTGMAAQVAQAGAELLAVKGRLDKLPATEKTSAGSGSGRISARDVGAQLQVVAALIRAGAPTRVYQVSLSSFDTHSAEKANHERLLGQLDQAVTGFFSALHGSPHGDGTVLMTYSEFGRRMAQNASGGTDHGTAAPLFVAGGPVRGGRFYGDEPSLGALDANGNLRATVDFRSVYATVLDRVLGVDPASILGGHFPTLPML